MQFTQYLDDEFILWNPTFGVRIFVTIDKIKQDNNTIHIWIDEPYEMVGPLDFKTLILDGSVNFEACIIMTKEYWKKNQKKLQQESFIQQQKIHQSFQEELKQHNQRKNTIQNKQCQYRKILKLPQDGNLKISQIKTAFKKLAKIEHPDVGGSHENFVKIIEAKEALILSIY
jgi:hypothetical protein